MVEMNIFTNYLEKLGSNFLVSAMIPSLALVVVSMLVFEPILHVSVVFQQQNGIYQLVSFGLFLVIPTVIIGFTLTALNTSVLKLFEGYIFFPRFSFIYHRMLNAHKNKARKLIIERERLKRRIHVIEQSMAETERKKRCLRQLRKKYYSVVAKYDHAYPSNLDEVLPTQFGNILKASESYPGTRYGLDGVEFWPRLIHVIPVNYQQSIDGTRNELSFLINMSVLTIVFFVLCLIAWVSTLAYPPQDPLGKIMYAQAAGNIARYIMAGMFSLACNAFFNRASIFSVESFGLMVRSAYDLFRLDLLKQFRLKMPVDSHEEFYTWKNLNEFVILGKNSLSFEKLDYDVKDE